MTRIIRRNKDIRDDDWPKTTLRNGEWVVMDDELGDIRLTHVHDGYRFIVLHEICLLCEDKAPLESVEVLRNVYHDSDLM